MKSENIASGRLQKISTGWTQGVNSVRNPWALPENQFKWGTNLSIRGGIAQTRPGYAMRLSLPPGNLQGGIIFQANKQKEGSFTREENGVNRVVPAKIFDVNGEGIIAEELSYMLFAVDGNVYYAPFPLVQPKNWNDFKLQNIKFDADVENIYFALATKSANLTTSEDELVTPAYTIVMMQDGVSAPAYWDGSNKVGSQDASIPTGTHMAYSGNRMWIADRNIVLASDLGDPTSWRERTTGTGRGDFAFVRPITGLVSYVGQDTSTRLTVFTDRATYSLASGILDRTQWISTANFQNTLYPTVGCVAPRSIAFQAGQMWWYSDGGLVAADVAAASYLSSQVLFKDVEMARTKRLMDGDPSNICAVSFENYLMYSVPYLSKLNTDTMVLDYAPAAEWGSGRQPAWAGVWTGTRPVQWTTGKIENRNRCFQFSVDYAPTADGSYNHLWEAFQPERYDSYLQINPDGSTTNLYNRIYCQLETPLLGNEMDLKQFIYSEIEATEIGGTVDVKVSYKGSKGKYLPILNTRLLAVTDDYQWKGSDYEDQIEKIGFLNTQYRRLITEAANRLPSYETCESPLTNDVDKAFSVLVEWCGQMGVEIVRMFMDPWSEKATGTPQQDETKACVVGQNGDNFTIDLAESPYDTNQYQEERWSAKVYKTITLSCFEGIIENIVADKFTNQIQNTPPSEFGGVRITAEKYSSPLLGDENQFLISGPIGRSFTISNLPNTPTQTRISQKTIQFASSTKEQITEITIELGLPDFIYTLDIFVGGIDIGFHTEKYKVDTSLKVSATATASFISTVSYDHAKEEAGQLAEQAATNAAQEFKSNNPC